MLTSSPIVQPHPLGEDLSVSIRCHTSADYTRVARHEIVLHRDWSVTTGHDLEAERFAVAFGGHLSCLDVPDAVVPAARSYLERQLRLVLPRLSAGPGRSRWGTVERVPTCCAGTSHASAVDAAAHLRSVRHVAALHGARTVAVTDVAAAVLTAHGARDPAPLPPEAKALVGTCVRGPEAARVLWDAGLPPALVRQIHAGTTDGRPQRPGYYLGVLAHRKDLGWVHVPSVPTPPEEEPAWVAWTKDAAEAERPWVEQGVARPSITALMKAGYSPADVALIARQMGVSGTSAAATLAAWVAAGAQPSPELLVEAWCKGDAGPGNVSRSTIDCLASMVTGTREQLAVALTICGPPSLAIEIVKIARSLEIDDLRRAASAWEAARRTPRPRSTTHA